MLDFGWGFLINGFFLPLLGGFGIFPFFPLLLWCSRVGTLQSRWGKTPRLKSREKCCNVPCGNALYLFIFIFCLLQGQRGKVGKKPTVINTGLNTHLRSRWPAGGRRGERGRPPAAAPRSAPAQPEPFPCGFPRICSSGRGGGRGGPRAPFPCPPLLRAGNGVARDFLSVLCFRCRVSAHEVPAGAGAAVPSHDGRRGPARGAEPAPGAGTALKFGEGAARIAASSGRGNDPAPAGSPMASGRGALRWRWAPARKRGSIKDSVSSARLRLMGELRAGSLRAR